MGQAWKQHAAAGVGAERELVAAAWREHVRTGKGGEDKRAWRVLQGCREGDYWMALRKGRGPRVDNSFSILGRVVGNLRERGHDVLLSPWGVSDDLGCNSGDQRESTVIAPMLVLTRPGLYFL